MQGVHVLPFPVKIRPLRCRRSIAPWKETAIGAARGLFPFRFRREPFLSPTAIGFAVVPGGLHDRKLLNTLYGHEDSRTIRIRRIAVSRGRNEDHIAFIGHFELVDLK